MSKSTIAMNLRRLRREQELSQEQLARKSGMSRDAYRNIETAKSEPRVGRLQAIATVLGVSVEQLIEPVRPPKSVRFEPNKRMPSPDRILVDVGGWLDDLNGS